MNYYSHNIGDYAQATMHLSLIEDAVYSRLLRRYYAEEAPLVNDMAQLCRWVGARSDEEKDAVEVVVNEFFVLHDGYWHNKRADREIDAYQAKSIKASESAAKRWHSNKSPKEDAHKCERNANAMPTHSEPNANQEPRTNNQEPIKEKEKEKNPDASPPAQPAPKKSTGAKVTGTRLPENFQVPDDWIDWATDERPDIPPADMRTVAESFVDYWAAKAGAAARKVDWQATWRNWVRNQKRYSSPPPKQQKFDPTAYVNRNRVPSHDIIDI